MEDKKEESGVKRYNGIVGKGEVDGPREISLSETSGTITYPTPGTFEITSNTGGRKIKVESSDPAVAEVSLKGTTVTITPKVPTEDGKKVTVTVTVGKKSVTYEGTINRGNITIEAEVYTGTYDGNAYDAIKKVTVNPEDAEVMYALGDQAYSTTIPKVMGGGEYTVSIKASKAGYVTKEIIKTITVNKQENTNGNLSLSETSGTLTYPTTKTFTITKNTSGGVLRVQSSNTNVATVSLSGNTVTITPKAITADGQTATITVTSEATADYEAQTATYTATVNRGSITLEATAYSEVYDANSHDAITDVTAEPEDVEIMYALVTDELNGGTYSTTIPKITEAGEYIVSIKATKAGYATKEITKKVTIREAVAKIGTDYYGTLQDAIDAVPTTNVNTTVELLKNTTEDTTVAANKKITFNLNNYTVTGRLFNNGTVAISGGTMTNASGAVINNQADGTVEISGAETKIEGKSTEKVGINNYGTLKVKGGTITSPSNAIYNRATTSVLEISGGTITGTGDNPTIYNGAGTVTISGGSLTATNGNVINNKEGAEVTVSGTAKLEGTATGHATIASYGTVNVNGGSLISTNNSVIYTHAGTATISGGSLTATNGNVIYNQEGAEVTVSGTAKLEGKATEYVAIANYGALNVKEGTITSLSNVIKNNAGTAIISGGSLTATNDNVINNKEGAEVTVSGTAKLEGTATGHATIASYGTVNVNGGSLTATNNSVIYNYEGATVEISGGSLTATNGRVIYNQEGAEVTVSGTAKLEGTATEYATIASYGTVNVNGGSLTSTNNSVIYTYGGTATISGGSLTSTNNGVIHNKEGAEVTVSGTAKLEGKSTEHVAIDNSGTLNVNGGTITSLNNVIYNNEGATVEISGTAKLEGKSTEKVGINNYGTVKVKGGTITSPSNTIYNRATTSVLEISGGTITGTRDIPTIYLKLGEFIMTGGTVNNTGGANYDVYKEGGTASHTGGTISNKNF